MRSSDPSDPPIFAQHSAPFQEALNQLAVYLQLAREDSGPGVVFLLGAGCSMQYGLPGFRTLLTRVYRDLYHDEPDLDEWGLSDLRARLDSAFANQDQEAIESVGRHLGNVRGHDCLAYRLLASLMKRRMVKHVVNMNFDSLLDDVCDAELSHSISRVHGSVRPGVGRPILNIEETEFFSEGDLESEPRMVRLLTENHVVSVGYSGVDAKMANALHPPVPAHGALGERPRRLFFVAIDPPDVRFTRAMLARSSQGFTITGPEGTFENFMLGLDATLRYKQKSGGRRPKPAQPLRSRKDTQLTLLELAALRNCLRLALRIRAAMNVADASETGIEEHGDRLFERCLELADRSRLRLTSPEKYLLYCACYLHDLGYFRAYSGGRINAHPGWFLLRNHGGLTAELLAEHLSPTETGTAAGASATSEPFSGIVPKSYHPDDAKHFVTMLIELCRRHTGVADDSANEPAFRARTMRVAGQPLPVRFDLLAALLPIGEEISSGHPFLPSGDPIDPAATPDFVVDDPALDIYLRRKEQAIEFTIDNQAIVGRAVIGARDAPVHDKVVSWLSKLADDAIGKFNRRVAAYAGDRLTYTPPHERPKKAGTIDLFDAALAERLDSQLDQLDWKGRKEKSPRPGTVLRILDLLALYALDRSLPDPGDGTGVPTADRREPIAQPQSDPVRRALGLLNAALPDKPDQPGRQSPHEGVLGVYLPVLLRGARPGMERRFCDDVRAIYLPAWRFCAQNWRRGNSPLVMACASLDLGSTPYRSEVTYGLRSLPIRLPKSTEPTMLGGHGGCTLCTGRLLYVISYARLFAHSFGHPFTVGNPHVNAIAGRRAVPLDPDQAVLGIVDYLLERSNASLLEPSVWWGIADDFRGGQAAVDCIQAVDYLAAAIRGIAFCLWVDRRLRPHTRKDLLGGERRRDLTELFARLWTSLCTAHPDRLLSNRSEEPHSYPLGEAARTYLMVRRLWQGVDDTELPVDPKSWISARQHMAAAVARLSGEDPREPEAGERDARLSRISQFYLLPAYAFLHGTAPKESHNRTALRKRLLRTYQTCAGSPIWIKDGDDAGSWGYNQENTARLVLTVSCFWRHVFDNSDELEQGFAEDGTIHHETNAA